MSYTLVQIHRMYTKSEAQCKPWSLGDNAMSVYVLSRNKCRTLMEAIDVGGWAGELGEASVSIQVIWETSVPSS